MSASVCAAAFKTRHPKRIDWRHMLPWLRRKPGAFSRWVLRDAMFPRSERGQPAYGEPAGSGRPANVITELAAILSDLGDRDELPDIKVLCSQFAPRPALMPIVQVMLPAASMYDELLEAA